MLSKKREKGESGRKSSILVDQNPQYWLNEGTCRYSPCAWGQPLWHPSQTCPQHRGSALEKLDLAKVFLNLGSSTFIKPVFLQIVNLVMAASPSVKELGKPEKSNFDWIVFRTMWNKRLCESLSLVVCRLAKSSILRARKFSFLTKLTTFSDDRETRCTFRCLFGWPIWEKG